MIAFDLHCGNGHQFEGWFGSSSDFDAQTANGMLACPLCDDKMVKKALSVPNVPRKGNQRSKNLPIIPTAESQPVADMPRAEILPPKMTELVQKLARAQTEMLDNSQWVGGKFAETARAMHYGEEQDRQIHGETSSDEAKALLDEGIAVTPLLFPVVPPSSKN